MTAKQKDQIAEALGNALISPNVSDSNLEPANVVDTLDEIGKSIKNAFGVYGERPNFLDGIGIALAGSGLGHPIGPALEAIAKALNRIAEALERRQ